MLLFVVGYAGSGKSSLGRRLARHLGVKFIDTDQLIEQTVGATIADIFYYEGEDYFRREESNVLRHIYNSLGDAVVATGGGLPTWGDNMAWMKEHGTTLYLRRSAEQIISRLSDYGRQKRPLFRGKSDEELLCFMQQHMAEREPYYALADIEVDCRSMSDEQAVEYIVQHIDCKSDE